MIRQPPRSPLSPYATRCRSRAGCSRSGPVLSARFRLGLILDGPASTRQGQSAAPFFPPPLTYVSPSYGEARRSALRVGGRSDEGLAARDAVPPHRVARRRTA